MIDVEEMLLKSSLKNSGSDNSNCSWVEFPRAWPFSVEFFFFCPQISS